MRTVVARRARGVGYLDRRRPFADPLGALRKKAKTVFRQNRYAYEVVRQWRARVQETSYVASRNSYAAIARSQPLTGGGSFARSYRPVRARTWKNQTPKRSLAETRIFAVLTDDPGGPRLVSTLQRSSQAIIFDLGQFRTPYVDEFVTDLSWRARLQDELVAAFDAAHGDEPIDLVLAYGSHFEFEPETLATLRARGVPVALLCLDDKHRFHEESKYRYPNGQKPLIGSVDVHLTNSRECVGGYAAEGAQAYYMPQGIDTELFRPVDVPLDIDVSFMGQRYGYRAQFIKALEVSGIDVECYGPGWGTRVVSEKEKIEIYSRSRINLGLGGVGYSDRISCVKGRDFEVPACGSFYLTTYDAELAELFSVGREIACYRNDIDCVELIRYYLDHEDVRRSIARAGHDRCVMEHTWVARLTEFTEWIGIVRREAPTSPAGTRE